MIVIIFGIIGLVLLGYAFHMEVKQDPNSIPVWCWSALFLTIAFGHLLAP